MDAQERLKPDYEQTTRYFHTLADSRFKLLALVPVVTGTAIWQIHKFDQATDEIAALSGENSKTSPGQVRKRRGRESVVTHAERDRALV